MINLHNLRWEERLNQVTVYLKDLPDIDLETIQVGDWIEGIGQIDTYAIVRFFHHLGRRRFRIIKDKE